MSVPRLVARAAVAQGTFYNYFDSLPAAVDAVGDLLLAEQYRTLLRVVDGAADAAEVVARAHLQTFLLFGHRPDVGRLIFDSGASTDRLIPLRNARGQMERTLYWGIETGVFAIEHVPAACSIQTGAVIGACQDIHRGRLSLDAAPYVTERLLRELGVPPRRAARLAGRAQEFEPWRPLPLVPEDPEDSEKDSEKGSEKEENR